MSQSLREDSQEILDHVRVVVRDRSRLPGIGVAVEQDGVVPCPGPVVAEVEPGDEREPLVGRQPPVVEPGGDDGPIEFSTTQDGRERAAVALDRQAGVVERRRVEIVETVRDLESTDVDDLVGLLA